MELAVLVELDVSKIDDEVVFMVDVFGGLTRLPSQQYCNRWTKQSFTWTCECLNFGSSILTLKLSVQIKDYLMT